MLHWPHSVYNRPKGGGMCAATCSMWWLGWILYKTTQLEGSYQSGGTWSTGAALVSPPTKEEKKQNPTLWHSNKNKHRAVRRWWPLVVLSNFFSSSLCFSIFLEGQPSLTKLQSKQSSVNMGWNKGKHGLLWRVCWVSDRVWWTFLILSLWCYFFSCWVRCFEKPGPPPRAHLLSHDNQTNGFHCCSRWPVTPGLWVALQRGAVWEAFPVQ